MHHRFATESTETPAGDHGATIPALRGSGEPNQVSIGQIYGRDHAHAVIRAAIEDYESEYGS